MKLHVSNLSPRITEEQLTKIFSEYGHVQNAEIIWSRAAGRVSGIAFVEMGVTDGIVAAKELTGKAIRNRRIYITLMGETAQPVQPAQQKSARASFK
jgi:RNA recognition motif-containing protein